MNHNDINRQCAEAMGWEVYEIDGEFWQENAEEKHLLEDFCTDWNAMKLLKEYANERDFALCLSEEDKDVCVAEFISRKVNGGYFCDDADTFTEAVALAFLKCFGEEKE